MEKRETSLILSTIKINVVVVVVVFKEKSTLQYISGFPFGEVYVVRLSYLAGLQVLEQG